jgi:hypothetical protein
MEVKGGRLFILASLLIGGWYGHDVSAEVRSSDFPVHVTQVPNPNDYTLFANSGWDGNWYVGYNNGWIKKLPSIPKGNYAKAFIGAKLGRMKTLPPAGRPPEFHPIPGEIWMAIASTPAWKSADMIKVATTEEIPLEGSAEFAIEGTGESQWFWSEIPAKSINMSGDNFLCLWSTSAALISVSSSPVLAAAWGGKDANTWLAKDVKGTPPSDPNTSLGSSFSYFQPAMGLKLIPAGPPHPIKVRILSWQNGTADHPKPILTASVDGDSIERSWVEYANPVKSGDVIRGRWSRVGRAYWKAPFIFSLEQTKLPRGRVLLRVAAANIWEERGYSQHFEVEVSAIDAKK